MAATEFTQEMQKNLNFKGRYGIREVDDITIYSLDETTNLPGVQPKSVRSHLLALSAKVGASLYKGALDASTNPNYPAMNPGEYYVVSVAGLVGGGAGTAVEVGDILYNRVLSAGGTEAAVGTSYFIVQKNMIPTTVAVLRTGEDNAAFVTAKTLKDQGITTAAATIVALAGGTTQQLLLTSTAAQKALTISSTLQTGKLIDIATTVADATVNLIDLAVTMSTDFTTGKTLKAYNLSITSGATDVDASAYIGYETTLISTALSKADLVGYKVVISGVLSGGAGTQTISGIDILPTAEINSATSTFYGARIDTSGMTNTAAANTYALYIKSTATTADLAYGIYATSLQGVFAVNDTANENVLTLTPNAGKNALEIYCDATSVSNAKDGIYISKDLINSTAAGALSNTEEAILIQSVNTSSAAASGAMTISGYLTTVQQVNSTSVASADIYSGTVCGLSYSATTSGAGTATSTGTCLEVDYNLDGTAGTLTLTSFDASKITYDTVGAVAYSNGTYNILKVYGADAGTPTCAATTTLSGILVDLSAIKTTDADLTLYGLNISMPVTGATSTKAAARFTDGTDTITFIDDTYCINMTGGGINHATILNFNMASPTVGTGFDGALVAKWLTKGKYNSGIIHTEFVFDLTNLVNSTTSNDIIGETLTANCHMGQITAAIHGTVFAMEIICLETPAGGDPDIDFYEATESTGTENDLITGLTETLLLARGGSWAINDRLSVVTALPTANSYLYLAVGSAGGAPGTYTAGKFKVIFYGL